MTVYVVTYGTFSEGYKVINVCQTLGAAEREAERLRNTWRPGGWSVVLIGRNQHEVERWTSGSEIITIERWAVKV